MSQKGFGQRRLNSGTARNESSPPLTVDEVAFPIAKRCGWLRENAHERPKTCKTDDAERGFEDVFDEHENGMVHSPLASPSLLNWVNGAGVNSRVTLGDFTRKRTLAKAPCTTNTSRVQHLLTVCFLQNKCS